MHLLLVTAIATIKIKGWLNGSRTSTGAGAFRLDDIVINGSVSTSGNTTPTLTTPTATAITTTGATLGATVSSNGGVALSARGTAWETAAAPTANILAEGGTSVAAFTHSRTGLTANTLYYYRGYATNGQGTSYSPDGTFTTLHNAPTIGTGSAATQTSFTANWTAPAPRYTRGVQAKFAFNASSASKGAVLDLY